MSHFPKWTGLVVVWAVTLLLLLRAGAAEPSTKPSPPDAAAVKRALNTVKEVYKSDIAKAKTPDGRAAMADKLIAAAKEEKDAAAHFALLSKARDIAVEGGDYDRVSIAVNAMDAAFEVDALKMRLDTATATAKTARTAEQKNRLVFATMELADQAVAAERYDIATSVADVGLAVARAGTDAVLVRGTMTKAQQVREIAVAYSDMRKAMAVLADRPSDPDASLTVGKFWCFCIGDWEKGLPMLALGSDAALKELAAREATGPTEADEVVKLGDDWWNLGENLTGSTQRQIRLHACSLYRRSLSGLNGLRLAQVKTRIAVVEGADGPPRSVKPFQCRVVSATYGAGKQTVDVTPEKVTSHNSVANGT